MSPQVAIFAAGCFWGVQSTFHKLPGVLHSEVGYIGGHTQNPSYEDVCSGTTGHAEAVRITFDADTLSYQELLHTFWTCHDPSTLNRQGPDIGTQYRSAIFFLSPEQEQAARHTKASLQKDGHTITTHITPATHFTRAEEYHQNYEEKRRPRP